MESTLDAGEYSTWLRDTRQSFLSGTGADVPCGDCVACCTASQFIQISSMERDTLNAIDAELLFPASSDPSGHVVLGYDQCGACPMLDQLSCSIYTLRPNTCRQYDCRVFAAAGLLPTEKSQVQIIQRVERWRFTYANNRSEAEHAATKAAAEFVLRNARLFPDRRIPTSVAELAILAIKVYDVFVDSVTDTLVKPRPLDATEVAENIVETIKTFERESNNGR